MAQSSTDGVSNRRATITLFLIAVLFFWAGQYIYLPTLPTYAQSKVGDLSAVGFILSMYGLLQALVRIPLGIASDWSGARKPFIIVGLALSGIGAWMMAVGNDAGMLALGRAITGASAGAWVVIVVAFSALFPPEEAVRASSLLMIFNSLGRIISTATAGWLTEIGGYALPFFIATGLGLLSALILLPINETRRPALAPNVQTIFRILLRRDVLAPSLLSAIGQYALWTSAFGFFTVLAKQLGATSVSQSALITTHITLAMLGSFLTAWRRLAITAHQWIYISFVLLALGIAIAACAPSLTILFIAPIFTGLGMGIGYPVLMGMSIVHVRDSERTIAMGLHQAIYAIGMFSGPAISGALADVIGLQPMFAITAGVALGLGIFGIRVTEILSAQSAHKEIMK
ncbi:MAG: MFS transporter [Chloroflexi bacterium]|nr:MFS transporter [Chloroflexota bacterium]